MKQDWIGDNLPDIVKHHCSSTYFLILHAKIMCNIKNTKKENSSKRISLYWNIDSY